MNILFFVVLQLCNYTICSTNTAPEFAAGKTYTYKYEALLMGGLPEEGLARAGVKVSSKVLISAATGDTLLLKVKDISLISDFF